MVNLYAVNRKLLDNSLRKKVLQLLPPSRVVRAEKMRNINDQNHRLLADALLFWKIRQLGYNTFPNIDIAKHGKPSISTFPDFYYNISHSADWVVMASSKNPIGVDVETVQRKAPFRVAERFFSDIENLQLNDCKSEKEKKQLFFSLWTLKESYVKAIGTGLTKPLNSFSIIFENNLPRFSEDISSDKVSLFQYWIDEFHILAACSLTETSFNKVEICSPEMIISNL